MSQEPEPGAMPYSPADDPSPLDLSLGSTSRRKKRKSHDIPNSPSKHPFPDGLSEEEKQKLERRRKRNRDSARRRRRKQTDYVDKLHEACEELQRANEHLHKEIRDLRTECTSLRVQLACHEPVCPMAVPLTVTLGLLTTPHDPVPEPPICTPPPPSPDEPNAPHCSGSQPPICTPPPPDTEELCAQLCSTPPPISTPHIIYAPGAFPPPTSYLYPPSSRCGGALRPALLDPTTSHLYSPYFLRSGAMLDPTTSHLYSPYYLRSGAFPPPTSYLYPPSSRCGGALRPALLDPTTSHLYSPFPLLPSPASISGGHLPCIVSCYRAVYPSIAGDGLRSALSCWPGSPFYPISPTSGSGAGEALCSSYRGSRTGFLVFGPDLYSVSLGYSVYGLVVSR
uniref:Long Meq n=1 Tax=Gallid alphaherpesvirus 2 TaxID=10390 RepID=Q9JGK4_9ALPH|nr:long Meq [Gallid alphaherpesvirus 2]